MNLPVFIILDTETTGVDPAVDQVIELGFAATTLEKMLGYGSALVKPSVPISPGASAVHHLVDEDVADAATLPVVTSALLDTWRGDERTIAYVAHNSPFDKSFLPQLADHPWLDTYRMAKRYLPDLPSHANQFLRYALHLDISRSWEAHRALGDCMVTSVLLRHMLNGPARDDFERLGVAAFAQFIDGPLLLELVGFGQHFGSKWADMNWGFLSWVTETMGDSNIDAVHTAKYWMSSYQPKLLDDVAFGKHRGLKWSQVPRDYLAWLLAKRGFDPDVMFTAETYLRNPRPTHQFQDDENAKGQ
jgi:exodeoxyribonuclease X